MRAGGALLVVAALLLAGCSQRTDAGGSAVQRAVDAVSGADAAPRLGSIGGVVQSSTLEPVPGARVTLVRENVTVTSDASGSYRFVDVAPGSHLVTAEAVGHRAASAIADARNGSVTLVNFTLARVPKLEPYHETQELKGVLSCALAARTPAGDERRDCAAADPNHRDGFEFPIGAGARSAALELVWDASSDPAGKRLELHARTLGYGASDADLGNVTGEGYARLVVPVDVMQKFYPEGGAMRARVQLADDGAPPAGFAFQRTFTLFVTTFYVQPGAADFTVVKNAS